MSGSCYEASADSNEDCNALVNLLVSEASSSTAKSHMEVYDSVAAVISSDVLEKLTSDQLELFEKYMVDNAGSLLRQDQLYIIHGSQSVVDAAKVFLSQMLDEPMSQNVEQSCNAKTRNKRKNEEAQIEDEEICEKKKIQKCIVKDNAKPIGYKVTTEEPSAHLLKSKVIYIKSENGGRMALVNSGTKPSNTKTDTQSAAKGNAAKEMPVKVRILNTKKSVVNTGQKLRIVKLKSPNKKMTGDIEVKSDKVSTKSENKALHSGVSVEKAAKCRNAPGLEDKIKLTKQRCPSEINKCAHSEMENVTPTEGNSFENAKEVQSENTVFNIITEGDASKEENVIMVDIIQERGREVDGAAEVKKEHRDDWTPKGDDQKVDVSGDKTKRERVVRNNISKEVRQFLKKVLKKEAEMKKGNVEEVETSERTCDKCGYVAKSLQGIRLHQYNYHREHSFSCEICFTTFAMKHMVDRHRRQHFDVNGKLKPAAIMVHKIKLTELGKEENLTGDLADQVHAHYLNLSGDEIHNNESDVLNEVNAVKMEQEEQTKDQTQPKMEPGPSQGGVQCDICFATLSGEKFLKTHKQRVHKSDKKKKTEHLQQQVGKLMKTNVQQTQYKCPKCEFVTTRIQNFTKHFNTHSKPDFFYCDLCNYKNPIKAEITRHKRNAHSEKIFKCPYCSGMYRTQPQLNAHVKIKHEEGRSYMCEECGKKLSTKANYQKHMDSHHADPSIQPGDRIMCQKCGRIFCTIGAFRSHQQKYHAPGDNSKLREPRDVSEGVLVLNGGTLFQCKHCLDYTNTVAREVRQHIVRMHLEKTHECPHCPQAFAKDSFLEKHIANHHLHLYAVDCDLCGRKFKNKTYLAFHKKRIHEKQTEYECDVCRKHFFRKIEYDSHMEIHKPEEERDWKFSCDVCFKKFRHKSNLTYHMLEHTGIKSYHCPICKKAFKTKTIRNNHMQTHSDARPIACPLCDKTFKQQKYLDVHLLTHEGCSYSCKACCRLFPHSKALEKHICRAVRISADKEAPLQEIKIIGRDLEMDNSSYTLPDVPDPSISAEHVAYEQVVENEGYEPGEIVQGSAGPSFRLDPETGTYRLTNDLLQQVEPTQAGEIVEQQTVYSSSSGGTTIGNEPPQSFGSLKSIVTDNAVNVSAQPEANMIIVETTNTGKTEELLQGLSQIHTQPGQNLMMYTVVCNSEQDTQGLQAANTGCANAGTTHSVVVSNDVVGPKLKALVGNHMNEEQMKILETKISDVIHSQENSEVQGGVMVNNTGIHIENAGPIQQKNDNNLSVNENLDCKDFIQNITVVDMKGVEGHKKVSYDLSTHTTQLSPSFKGDTVCAGYISHLEEGSQMVQSDFEIDQSCVEIGQSLHTDEGLSDPNEMYLCTTCNAVCATKDDIQNHMKEHLA